MKPWVVAWVDGTFSWVLGALLGLLGEPSLPLCGWVFLVIRLMGLETEDW